MPTAVPVPALARPPCPLLPARRRRRREFFGSFLSVRLVWLAAVGPLGQSWPGAEGKVQDRPFYIEGGRWVYLSKFAFDIGRGNFSARLKLVQPLPADANLTLHVYLDENWHAVEALKECDRHSLAKQIRPIVLPRGLVSNWSSAITGTLNQYVRPHVWYFAVSSCEEGASLPIDPTQLRFEITMKQGTGSHFSSEQKGMLPVQTFLCVVYTGFILLVLRRISAFFGSAGSVHPVINMLLGGLVVQYVARVAHVGHLWRYAGDGMGCRGLEIFSEVLVILSQVTQTTLMILIGAGYTLLQAKLGGLDIVVFAWIVVGGMHMILVAIEKRQDDASNKWHENEGTVGWVLLVMRLALYACFLAVLQRTSREGGFRLQHFLAQFRIAGSAYFLAYPSFFLLAKVFAPYWRHRVMTTGLTCMEMGSNVYLVSLFLTRGEYFRVSTLSASELPGGLGGGILDKDE